MSEVFDEQRMKNDQALSYALFTHREKKKKKRINKQVDVPQSDKQTLQEKEQKKNKVGRR